MSKQTTAFQLAAKTEPKDKSRNERNLGRREGTLQELKLVENFDSVVKGYESVEVLCSNFTELSRKS